VPFIGKMNFYDKNKLLRLSYIIQIESTNGNYYEINKITERNFSTSVVDCSPIIILGVMLLAVCCFQKKTFLLILSIYILKLVLA